MATVVKAPEIDLPGYRVLSSVGEGGMGRVILAEDLTLGRKVAIKLISEALGVDEEMRERFLREARAMAAVEHPHIVRLYSFGEIAGQPYFVMEYVAGESLGESLQRRGRLGLDESLRILDECLQALAAAWQRGIIHRDLKPGNILLGSDGRARVADFGLAKRSELAAEPALTGAGNLVGTPSYVSPEQALGEPVDFRSDVYSLGIVLFEALTGDRPFRGTTAFAVVNQHLHQPLPSLREQRPELPAEVEELLRWMTAKDRGERPDSYDELMRRVTALRAGGAAVARGTSAHGLEGARRERSLVVLPFSDFSPGGAHQHLADGMTDELITMLSKHRSLRVIARTSAMLYKGRAIDLRAVGDELDVALAVEGSIRVHRDTLRISAQLVDCGDRSELWAERYYGSLEDIFSFQEEVARSIADTLSARIGEAPTPARRATNPKAYEYFLHGKLLVQAPTVDNLDRAEVMLQRALELDPDYAAAHGVLSTAYLWNVDSGLRPEPRYLELAEAAARRALALNPKEVAGLYTLAGLTLKRAEIEQAFDRFCEILEIEPNHGFSRLWRGVILVMSSFFDEALSDVERLLSTDPFWPMAHWLHSMVFLHRGQFAAAADRIHAAEAEVPSKLVWLTLAQRCSGELDRAWHTAQQVRALDPEGVLWPCAHAFVYGAEGRRAELLECLTPPVLEFCWDFFLTTPWVASFYAMAGEADEALRWLDRSIAIGNRNWRWFEIDPGLAPIREHPEFRDVLARARDAAAALEGHLDRVLSPPRNGKLLGRGE